MCKIQGLQFVSLHQLGFSRKTLWVPLTTHQACIRETYAQIVKREEGECGVGMKIPVGRPFLFGTHWWLLLWCLWCCLPDKKGLLNHLYFASILSPVLISLISRLHICVVFVSLVGREVSCYLPYHFTLTLITLITNDLLKKAVFVYRVVSLEWGLRTLLSVLSPRLF